MINRRRFLSFLIGIPALGSLVIDNKSKQIVLPDGSDKRIPPFSFKGDANVASWHDCAGRVRFTEIPNVKLGHWANLEREIKLFPKS